MSEASHEELMRELTQSVRTAGNDGGLSEKEIQDLTLLFHAYVSVARAKKTPPDALQLEERAVQEFLQLVGELTGISEIFDLTVYRTGLAMGMCIGKELTELRHA